MSYDKVEKAASITVGTKHTIRAIEKGQMSQVVVAEDADDRVIGKILSLCKEYEIPVSYVDSMRHLGKVCGIEVSAAVVGIKQESTR